MSTGNISAIEPIFRNEFLLENCSTQHYLCPLGSDHLIFLDAIKKLNSLFGSD